jgi:hypothetical protein
LWCPRGCFDPSIFRQSGKFRRAIIAAEPSGKKAVAQSQDAEESLLLDVGIWLHALRVAIVGSETMKSTK